MHGLGKWRLIASGSKLCPTSTLSRILRLTVPLAAPHTASFTCRQTFPVLASICYTICYAALEYSACNMVLIPVKSNQWLAETLANRTVHAKISLQSVSLDIREVVDSALFCLDALVSAHREVAQTFACVIQLFLPLRGVPRLTSSQSDALVDITSPTIVQFILTHFHGNKKMRSRGSPSRFLLNSAIAWSSLGFGRLGARLSPV